MASEKKLSVKVVSAEQEVFSGEAVSVTAKTTEGEIGILVQHEPVLAILAEGTVRIKVSSSETITANADGGFLSVENDTVTIVAGKAALV